MLDISEFDTAKENMEYDEVLVRKLHSCELASFFRIYTWKTTSVTQSVNRDIPIEFANVDSSSRFTGGGLVFHCPGDIVFSLGNQIEHSVLPKKLKERCAFIANFLTESLNELNIPASVIGDTKKVHQNINFCSSYHNPYEVMIGEDKVIGIALKRTKDWIVFQGVIHLKKSLAYFGEFSNLYGSFFTNGIQSHTKHTTQDIQVVIINQLKRLKLV